MTDTDIASYRSWFADPKLSAAIDQPSDAWIAHVREAATAWSVLVGDDLVAHLQTEEESAAEGTLALVVAPQRQGGGLGSEILTLFLKHHLLEQQTIRAHIAIANEGSRKTFAAAGFADGGQLDRDGFAVFTYQRATK